MCGHELLAFWGDMAAGFGAAVLFFRIIARRGEVRQVRMFDQQLRIFDPHLSEAQMQVKHINIFTGTLYIDLTVCVQPENICQSLTDKTKAQHHHIAHNEHSFSQRLFFLQNLSTRQESRALKGDYEQAMVRTRYTRS